MTIPYGFKFSLKVPIRRLFVQVSNFAFFSTCIDVIGVARVAFHKWQRAFIEAVQFHQAGPENVLKDTNKLNRFYCPVSEKTKY
jgi:hypothetical protein